MGRAGRGLSTFLPLWAANVFGPPTFGTKSDLKKYRICVLKDELFLDGRVALTNHSGLAPTEFEYRYRPKCNGTTGSIMIVTGPTYVRVAKLGESCVVEI